MGSAERHSSTECSSTLAPIIAIGLSNVSQFLQVQLHSVSRHLYRCTGALLDWVANGSSFRLRGVFRAILILSLSAFALLLSLTSLSLGQAIAAKIEEVITSTGKIPRDPFRQKEIEDLPEPVQRYFRYALKDGQHAVAFCSIKQTGVFRLRASPGMRADDGWKKVKAAQYFSVGIPGYVWVATIQLAPLLWIRGWDSFVNGHGHMFWKLLSALTLVNFGGPEIDRAALSRYLSEAVFFPTALLPSERLQWESDGTDSARATLSFENLAASAVFHFNDVGQVTHLQTAERPRRLDDGTTSVDSWTGYYSDYKCNNGMNVPCTMEAVWNLVGGDFRYAVLHTAESHVWGDMEAKQYLL